ncbi:glutaminase [Brevibacillus sp. NRS-1366]|uniref:glutaminase n=1 Tax=Brevibacillus sp. NRS-1366 TaxID=3233899 RepID=UPI003D252BA9
MGTNRETAPDQNQVQDDVKRWVEQYRGEAQKGQCAAYIPALAKADPAQLGICVIGPDGTKAAAGNWEVAFTLQSISKVISFIAACMHHGIPYVLERVDVEPTGDAFDSMIRLEMHKPGRPFNPMINAGAITVSSLLQGHSTQAKFESLIAIIQSMTGRQHQINEEVYESEWKTAHRNRALAHYLTATGFLGCGAEEALEVYIRQCSIEVTTEDIAMIGFILAHDGYHPIRREQLFSKEIARLTKALMVTCGMYNASGNFAAFVGVPAKSGVSGGIMAAVPPRGRPGQTPFGEGCGIGVYGPAIDQYGNSVAGTVLLGHIAGAWDLSIY